MAAPAVELVVVFNKLPGLIEGLHPGAKRALTRYGNRVARLASARTDRVETGAMKAGYTSALAGDEVLVWNRMPYHRWQELGTRHIRGGFWLTDAHRELEAQLPGFLADEMGLR